MTPLARFYVKRLPADRPPFQVDLGAYRRFDQRNNMTVGRPQWDQAVRTFNERAGETRVKRILSGQAGYSLRDYALHHAAGALGFQHGTNINLSNHGLLEWQTAASRPFPGVPAWQGVPEAAAAMVKQAARYLGADLVGITPLNPLWFYSHAFWSNGAHKQISFREAAEPVETESELVIPSTMRWVIVMGKRMDQEMISLTPTPTGCAETALTYSSMVQLTVSLAEFLRGLGYQAIPSVNDLGLTIPMAMEAGFGEQGRHGKLITPEFGPSVRLCKVITDLPLARDYPASFGVARFCESCQRCARECPSKSIPAGPRTWTGPNISNNPGVFTWHLDNETCRKYWNLALGDNCTVCIRVCPFSKGPNPIHHLARAAVSGLPALDPLLARMDTWLGYGGEKDTNQFWNASR
jgi:reductive dehalogenase